MSFSTVTIEGKKSAPDRIYYNGLVLNNTLTSVKQKDDPVVQFQDQRQNPLVPDSSNYEVSVQNFSLNGCPKTLPLFIPQISPNFATNMVDPLITVTQAELFGVTNQTITYSYDPITAQQTLAPGNYVQSVFGFLNEFFNFSSPMKVIAATANTFTINVNNVIVPPNPAPFSEYSNFASCTYYNPGDVTTTIYSVTVAIGNGSIGSISSTVYVVWVPENKAPYTEVPITANPTQIETDYYYCYTYTHWISLVNTALNTAWTNCANGNTFGTQCPWFEYDEVTTLFAINQDTNTCMVPYGVTLPAPYSVSSGIGGSYQNNEYSFVGMNTCLENLLTNFPSTYYSAGQIWSDGATSLPESVIDMGLNVDLLLGGSTTDSPIGISLRTQPKSSVFQLINPFTGTGIAGAFFVRLPQDFNSTSSIWSPISSFVLATSQIPIRTEASANPIVFGNGNINALSSGGVYRKVLIETPINAVTADVWKGFVLYEPKIPIYSSLDPSHDGISNIDITLFWRNRLTNSLVPVHVPNQGSMAFRLLFKKKSEL